MVLDPLTIHEFKLFVPVVLNGRAAYAFLDTGATMHRVTAAASEGMERIGVSASQGAFGRRERESVRIAALSFLGEPFDDLTADVDDDPEHFAGVPFPVSLALGVRVLLAQPLVLDFKRLRIGFVKDALRPDLVRLPAEFVRGLPLITCQLGHHDLHAMFDTGAGFSTLNAVRLKHLGVAVRHAYSLEAKDSTGASEVVEVFGGPQLALNGLSLGEVEFLAIDLRAVEELLGTRVDFVLGVNTMLTSARVWVVDAREKCIRLATHGVDVI